MEEHVIAHLTLLTVTVPVDTQGPTVRTEVRIGTSRAYNREGMQDGVDDPVLFLKDNTSINF